jgi:glycosyltransferase involved in cell wall biosynthesis
MPVIRVLWFTNIIFDESDGDTTGTWLTTMAKSLHNVGNFTLGNVCYSSSHEVNSTSYISQWILSRSKAFFISNNSRIKEIEKIVTEFKPDIIHIWGTESDWGLNLMHLRNLPPVLLSIQGISRSIYNNFYGGLTRGEIFRTIRLKEVLKLNPIFIQKWRFKRWQEKEKIIIKNYYNICTQSDSSRAIIVSMNPNANLYHNDIVLRNVFYKTKGWNLTTAKRFSILFASAYPAPFKGLDFALKVVAKLKPIFPKIELRIAGWQPLGGVRQDGYIGYILGLIPKLGLNNDNVTWLGALDSVKLEAEMRHSSVFLTTSYVESYCVTLAEAMCVGIPSVASFVGGMTSLGVHEESLLYYPVNDIDFCVFQLHRILSDDTLALKLSSFARSQSNSKSCKDRIVQNQIDIYNSILD